MTYYSVNYCFNSFSSHVRVKLDQQVQDLLHFHLTHLQSVRTNSTGDEMKHSRLRHEGWWPDPAFWHAWFLFPFSVCINLKQIFVSYIIVLRFNTWLRNRLVLRVLLKSTSRIVTASRKRPCIRICLAGSPPSGLVLEHVYPKPPDLFSWMTPEPRKEGSPAGGLETRTQHDLLSSFFSSSVVLFLCLGTSIFRHSLHSKTIVYLQLSTYLAFFWAGLEPKHVLYNGTFLSMAKSRILPIFEMKNDNGSNREKRRVRYGSGLLSLARAVRPIASTSRFKRIGARRWSASRQWRKIPDCCCAIIYEPWMLKYETFNAPESYLIVWI